METESFLELAIVIIVLIGSAITTAGKARKERVREAARQSASPVKPKAAAPKPAHPYAAPVGMPPMAFGDIPGQVITPKVHTHVQPDCPTHDAPGSLGGLSPEGKDPCHEPMFARSAIAEPVQEEGGLSLDWSGENMVKAFVMQEVLTRPGNRTRRCAR